MTQILAVVASLLLMGCSTLFVNYTRAGTAMRAVSLDHDTSRLMGIDVNRVIVLVFFIGPALGGAAGVLVALHYGSFNFTLGWTFGLKAFIAAILGGIGNIPGAMLGGILLGTVESLGAVYLGSQWKDVIAYALLALILIVRPTGDPGRTRSRKALAGSRRYCGTFVATGPGRVKTALLVLAGLALALLLPLLVNDYYRAVLWTIGIYMLLGLRLNIIVGYAGLFQLGHAAFYALGAYTAAMLNLIG
jgi:branched-subunit amino acid ABC-type transport system permease component